MRVETPPAYILPYSGQINCFEICQTDFAYNLLCIAGERKLSLVHIRFPEESESGEFSWDVLKDIHHESRCHALAFAPDTTLMVAPKAVTLCSADADFMLRIFRTNLQNSDSVQELKGHSSYINDVTWDYGGEFLASVSDDHSCKIWNVESNFEMVTTFCLSSSGVSVKWHPEEPNKVMVAEKKGVIHMYNVRTQQAIISVESPKCPLTSADWSLNNHQFIVALAAGDIMSWNLQHLSAPSDIKSVHEDGGRVVRFSPNSEVVFASVGRPDITLKVFTQKSSLPLIEAPLKIFGGMAWHNRLPYIAAAYDRKLCFWKVQVK